MVVSHLPKKEWNKENVTKFIKGCRTSKGIPMFKTHFAGQPFETMEGERSVMALCWGGIDRKGKEMSKQFVNVPEEMIKKLDKKTSDWRWLIEKYEPEKFPELKEKPITLGKFKYHLE